MIFKHLSGKVMEIDEGDIRVNIYSNSPSWKLIKLEEIVEETNENSSYDKIKKDNLYSLAKDRGLEVNRTLTKKEIIELLENNDKEYKSNTSIKFTDNII